MAQWKDYVISVVTVSLCCSIVIQMVPDSGKKELLHIISGLILITVILQPVSGLRLEDLRDFIFIKPESADQYLAAGEMTADDTKKEYIADACEAYILNKAKTMGTEISVKIFLNKEYYPVFAELHGETEPEFREVIERILVSDLGITKENQLWTGNPENSS